jgi:transposase
MLEAAVDAIPPVYNGRVGRPRRRPKKLHGDKAYDFAFCRQALRKRGITPSIARRGVECSERLGRYRWVAERTLAWLSQYRRLCVRYESRDDTHLALVLIGRALICFKQILRFC